MKKKTKTLFSSLAHWKELDTMPNPVAVSTPSTHSVVPKSHFQIEETRALCRNVWLQILDR